MCKKKKNMEENMIEEINTEQGVEDQTVDGFINSCCLGWGKISSCHFVVFFSATWFECLHSHLSAEWISWALGPGNLLKPGRINLKDTGVNKKTTIFFFIPKNC